MEEDEKLGGSHERMREWVLARFMLWRFVVISASEGCWGFDIFCGCVGGGVGEVGCVGCYEDILVWV